MSFQTTVYTNHELINDNETTSVRLFSTSSSPSSSPSSSTLSNTNTHTIANTSNHAHDNKPSTSSTTSAKPKISEEKIEQLIAQHFGGQVLNKMETIEKRWRAFTQRKHLNEVEKYHEWRLNSIKSINITSHTNKFNTTHTTTNSTNSTNSTNTTTTTTTANVITNNYSKRDIRDILALDAPIPLMNGFGYGLTQNHSSSSSSVSTTSSANPKSKRSVEEMRHLKRIDNAMWRAWFRHRRNYQLQQEQQQLQKQKQKQQHEQLEQQHEQQHQPYKQPTNDFSSMMILEESDAYQVSFFFFSLHLPINITFYFDVYIYYHLH